MSSESVAVVSTHPMPVEAFYVGVYYAPHEMACKRLHEGRRVEASDRR